MILIYLAPDFQAIKIILFQELAHDLPDDPYTCERFRLQQLDKETRDQNLIWSVSHSTVKWHP
jgi:hypothetical protein